MHKKTVSGIYLILLMVSISMYTININPWVRASGTAYIGDTLQMESDEQPHLRAPWKGTARITQGNSGTASHYDHGTWDNTYALDVDLPLGTDVLAPADGYVNYVDNDQGGTGGKELAIEHTGPTLKKFVTAYLHLSDILVGLGNFVYQGQIIGKSGQTGSVTGPHLHFHIWKPKGSEPEWAYDSHTMPIERLVMKQVGIDSDFREYDGRKGELDDSAIAGRLFESDNQAIAKTKILGSGDNLIHGFAYHAGHLWASTRTEPCRILKIDIETLDYQKIVLDVGLNMGEDLIVAEGDVWVILYTSPSKIIKIDPETMFWEVAVSFKANEISYGGSLEYAFGYLWAGGNNKIARVDLTNLAYEIFSYSGSAQFHALTSGGGYLWGSCPHYSYWDGWYADTIYRINPGNPIQYTSVYINTPMPDDIGYLNGYLFAGSEKSLSSVYKISDNMAYSSHQMSNTLCYGVSAYFGSIWGVYLGSPGKVIEFDKDLKTRATYGLPTGFNDANEIAFDTAGNMYVTCWESPAKIVKLSERARTRVKGIDVSADVDWTEVRHKGYDFAFVKATEGIDWPAPDSSIAQGIMRRVENAREAGLLVGVYNFGRPVPNKDGAKTEAESFVRLAASYLTDGYLRPVLDVEDNDYGEYPELLGKEKLAQWIEDWMDTVEERTGVKPILYMNPFLFQFLSDSFILDQYDIWIPDLRDEEPTVTDLPDTEGWETWVFWQYKVRVVLSVGEADLDLFNGNEATLRKFIIVASDLNKDGEVNIADVIMIAVAFGSKPGDPKWNATADIDRSGNIDIVDLVMVAKDFGKTV